MLYFIMYLFLIFFSFSLCILIFYDSQIINILFHMYNDLGECIVYILYNSTELYNKVLLYMCFDLSWTNKEIVDYLTYFSINKYLILKFYYEEYIQLNYTLYLLCKLENIPNEIKLLNYLKKIYLIFLYEK